MRIGRNRPPAAWVVGLITLAIVACAGSTSADIPIIEVDCPDLDGAGLRRLTAGQELAFDGTVVSTSLEENTAAGWNAELLADGQPDRTAQEGEPAAATETWPWTTFQVHSWYTHDHGSTISIWTAGLDVAVGERWLVAGPAFGTPDGLGEHEDQSGMAAVCATSPHDPGLEQLWTEWFGEAIPPDLGLPLGEPDPKILEAIEEGRRRWSELGLGTYSATIRLYRESASGEEGCPADDGAIRMSVVDGSVVDAYNVDAFMFEGGCRIEDLESVTTIDGLFDLAALAAAAEDEREVEIDERYGFPKSFSGYDRAFEMYGSVELFISRQTDIVAGADIAGAIEEHRVLWNANAPSAYRFVIEWQCFCSPEVRGPFEIHVENGTPVSIEHVDGLPLDMTPDDLPETVDQLFEFIAGADADWIVTSFDTELGYPAVIFIDYITNAIDDELTIVIVEMEPE